MTLVGAGRTWARAARRPARRIVTYERYEPHLRQISIVSPCRRFSRAIAVHGAPGKPVKILDAARPALDA